MLRTYRFQISVILCWTLSLLAGLCYGAVSSSSVAEIYILPLCPDFLGFVISGVIPVIFAVLVFRYRLSFLVVPLLIVRGFIHGYSLMLLRFLLGDTVWLDSLLHMSCQSISCSLFLFILLGYHTVNKKSCALITVSTTAVLCILFFITLGKAC